MALKDIIKKILDDGNKEKEKIIQSASKEIQKKKEELKKEGKKLEEKMLKEAKEKLGKEKEEELLNIEMTESKLTLSNKIKIIDEIIFSAIEKVKKERRIFSEWLRRSIISAVEKGKGEIYYPKIWEDYFDRELKNILEKKAGDKIKFSFHDKGEIVIVKQGRKETTISLEESFFSEKERLKALLNKILFE